MEKSIFELLIPVISGLLGGLFTYFFIKKNEILYTKTVENKIRIYT